MFPKELQKLPMRQMNSLLLLVSKNRIKCKCLDLHLMSRSQSGKKKTCLVYSIIGDRQRNRSDSLPSTSCCSLHSGSNQNGSRSLLDKSKKKDKSRSLGRFLPWPILLRIRRNLDIDTQPDRICELWSNLGPR
jgi:hypothetical protein